MKKAIALLMALALLMSILPAFAQEAPVEEPVVITIFHTNDVHGRYSSEAGMGYAMMAAFINQARKDGNVLVLDAGDTLHGTVFANSVKGESVVDVMNAIGYDAMVPGNHDFNYGYERLKELEEMMDFPLVSANIMLKDGGEAFTPYVIIEIAGKKIAIVGADNPQMQTAIHPDHTAALSFEDESLVAAAAVKARGEADAVIILAHWGCDGAYDPNSVEALATIPGVTLVIDGHSHTRVYEIEQGLEGEAALVTSTGEYLNNLGRVTMTFDPEGKLSVEAELIPNPGFFEDHDTINVIEGVEAAQSAELDKVVGETAVELMGERAVVRTQESNWGNLACDIFLAATGADVAIMNGGNIRQTIPAGPVTARDINTVFPFGNLVVMMEVSGQALLDALEVGLSLYPETSGGFPQIGGMTLTFDPGKEPGSRITELLIAGKPVDPEALYKLTTNDFLAAGGDGYVSLGAYDVSFTMGAMDEVIVDYLRENSPVAPKLEGRVKIAGEEAAEEAEPEEEVAKEGDVEELSPEEESLGEGEPEEIEPEETEPEEENADQKNE